MFVSTKFETIRLTENGIMLSDKSSKQKEILFSELDKIYITVNKISQTQEALFILVLIGITFISLLFLQAEIIIPIFIFITFIIILKLNQYKSYGLKIRLKNGTYFKKQIPSKLKYETVAIVNDIVKEFYNYKINT
jgi:hypothetical protein